MTKRFLLAVVAPLSALIFAFGVAAIALILNHIDPLFAYREMLEFATTTASAISIANRAIPLYISAIAVAVGFKMGLFNIGVEGQYLLAALLAAWFGAVINLPPVLHIALILLVAMAVGAGWSAIAAELKVRRGVHEVVSTIMLNFIAFGLSAWLFLNFLQYKTDALTTTTGLIPESGQMPSLNWIIELFGVTPRAGSELQGFLIVAIAVGIAYHLLVSRSRFGYDLRASGINPSAARAAGVDPNTMIRKAMWISGGAAGLVGMSQLLGFFHQYTSDFPRALGFNGIAVALLGRNHPVGMALGALLIALMNRSALILDLRGVPREIVTIIQGIVVLAVVIAYEVVQRLIERQTVRAAARATAEAAEVGE